MKTFVNCSNHPSVNWSDPQKAAAEKYGKIVDVPFPAVATNLSDAQLQELAEKTTEAIIDKNPETVMCMGEFVVCFRIVQKLKAKGICVLASCTERQAVEYIEDDGTVRKQTIFVFQGFREY